MTCDIIRQAILKRQPHELTGIGLVETALDARSPRDVRVGTSAGRDRSIDATLVRLSRSSRGQNAVELDYPWGTSDGTVGAMLGIIPEHCGQIEPWQAVDAA